MISYVHHGKLNTEAYIFFQDLLSIQSSNAEAAVDLKSLQVTTTEVALWTGLEFDQKLSDSNVLKFYSGPERISTSKHKELLNKRSGTVSLDEGIVGETSIKAAREKFPLNDFYDLIEQVSWM